MNESARHAIEEFAGELADLRRAAGSPSFRTIEGLSENGRLRRSTAADAVTGDHLPSMPAVFMFVRACHEFARRNHIEVNDEDFDRIRWRDRWIQVKKQSQGLAERARAETVRQPGNAGADRRHEPEPHQEPVREELAGGLAADVEQVREEPAPVDKSEHQELLPVPPDRLIDSNLDVRRAAVQALASREEPGVIEALLARTNDSDGNVRRAAVQALASPREARLASLAARLAERG